MLKIRSINDAVHLNLLMFELKLLKILRKS